MKKFIYLMAMVCTLGFFTACSSDDDDPTVWDTFKAGTYNVWGQELDTEDGEVDYNFMDFDMNIEKAGDQTAKVTLTDKSGKVTVNIREATIIAVDGYTLRGQGTVTYNDNVTKATENTNSEMVNFTAKISADYKNISVELKTADGTFSAGNSTEKPAVSKLLATWNLEPVTMYDENGNQTDKQDDATAWKGSFKMNWETAADCPPIMGFIPAATAPQMAESIVNQLLPTLLKSVTFTADGKIIAQYAEAKLGETGTEAPATPNWQIAEGYATYKIVDENQIIVFLSNEKIAGTITDPAKQAAIGAVLSAFKDGVPVNVRFSNSDNTAFFYLNQEFATKLAANPVLVKMVESLNDDDLNGFAGMIKAIVQQLPELMNKTTKFEAGLELIK